MMKVKIRCSTSSCKSTAVIGDPQPLCEHCMEKLLREQFVDDWNENDASSVIEDLTCSGINPAEKI